jgi:hypothetical protein
MTCQGCLTRQQIQAKAWLNNTGEPMDSLCHSTPELWNFGFYRRINDKDCPKGVAPPCYEFLSFCDKRAEHMVAYTEEDIQKILDALLPKKGR